MVTTKDDVWTPGTDWAGRSDMTFVIVSAHISDLSIKRVRLEHSPCPPFTMKPEKSIELFCKVKEGHVIKVCATRNHGIIKIHSKNQC